jgi:hypothetical protein
MEGGDGKGGGKETAADTGADVLRAGLDIFGSIVRDVVANVVRDLWRPLAIVRQRSVTGTGMSILDTIMV